MVKSGKVPARTPKIKPHGSHMITVVDKEPEWIMFVDTSSDNVHDVEINIHDVVYDSALRAFESDRESGSASDSHEDVEFMFDRCDISEYNDSIHDSDIIILSFAWDIEVMLADIFEGSSMLDQVSLGPDSVVESDTQSERSWVKEEGEAMAAASGNPAGDNVELGTSSASELVHWPPNQPISIGYVGCDASRGMWICVDRGDKDKEPVRLFYDDAPTAVIKWMPYK